MKINCYSLLLVGLSLLLLSFTVGCSQSQLEAYQAGYEAGFTDGYESGLAQSGTGSASTPSITPQLSPKTETPTTPKVGLPADAVYWDEAKDRIGDRTTVCGLVVETKYSVTSNGKPTWLNIGKDYPSSERFVVIIWGENRGNFPQPPENYYNGKIICVTGLIQEYNGIAQIEVKTPDNIQEQ